MHYANKYWGVPAASDAAFLFYRTDKVKTRAGDVAGGLPADAAKQGGIVYQGAAVRGPDL